MTWKQDMLAALQDEAFHDVYLVGTDSIEVPATKKFLASRSPVFKRMFLGDFQERASERVSLNYPSVVLQVLVKYCYMDEIDLDMIYSDEEADCLTDQEATWMVQLRDAANYFELNELFLNVSNELGESVFQQKDEARCFCAILRELFIRGESDGPLWNMIMTLLEVDPELCLLSGTNYNKGIVACPARLLAKILESKVKPFAAAMCLQKWSEANEDILGQQDEDQESDTTTDIELLQKIADGIRVEDIPIQQLSKVQPCRFFPMERLYKAFVNHGQIYQAGIPSPSTPNNFKALHAHVLGAGVECLNGTYSRSPSFGFGGKLSFYKKGLYGDVNSVFKLVHDVDTWKFFVCPDEDKDEGRLLMYESAPTSHPDKIPFALWSCHDGKAPTPYVAVVDLLTTGGTGFQPTRRRYRTAKRIQGRNPTERVPFGA